MIFLDFLGSSTQIEGRQNSVSTAIVFRRTTISSPKSSALAFKESTNSNSTCSAARTPSESCLTGMCSAQP